MNNPIRRQLRQQHARCNAQRGTVVSQPPASSTSAKKATFPFLLLLILVACTEPGGQQDARRPSVVSVSPSDGQQRVPVTTAVTATLGLTSGGVNLMTLTDASVTLTAQGESASVPTALSAQGTTLTVQPEVSLEPATRYEFAVTPELKDEAGISFNAYTSTFTTAGASAYPDSDLQPGLSRLVFTAGGAKAVDTQTLTLLNVGDTPITFSRLVIEQERTAQFALSDAPTLPATLAPGATLPLELTFSPSALGPQSATLQIISNTPDAPQLAVDLRGLSVHGQGGEQEPSLQWILDTFDIPVVTGDDDPGTTPLVETPTNLLVGEEVAAQRFQKAGTGPVTVEVLATFGVDNDPVLEFGWYQAGVSSSTRPVFEVQQTPPLNAQRLMPEVDGGMSFDPGDAPFGFYSFWPTNRFFGERSVYTEDALNTFEDAVSHHVRTYPYKDADGEVEANAYVLATDEFTTGSDYNDVVVVVRNVRPVQPSGTIDGLSVQSLYGPFPNRLVLHRIQNTSGNLCDPQTSPGCNPDATPWAELETHNLASLQLSNTGTAPLDLSLVLSDPDAFSLPDGESSLSLMPGGSETLKVQFIKNSGDKGVYGGTLRLESADGQAAGVELAGIYMNKPEGSREVPIADLVRAFGYTTDIGANSRGTFTSSPPAAPLAGEEVRSELWERVDPDRPVVVRQLAAFHSCCNEVDNFALFTDNSNVASFRHDRRYGQTTFPLLERDSSVAGMEAEPDAPFEIRIAGGFSTDPTRGRVTGDLSVRLWPVRDRNGQLVLDTYLVGFDNTSKAPPNYDFQDNLYLITNIQPAEGGDDR